MNRTSADLRKIANVIDRTGAELTTSEYEGEHAARLTNHYSVEIVGRGDTAADALSDLAGKIASVYNA